MRVDLVTHEIENLKLTYPDVFEDADGWDLTLSSECGLDELLSRLIQGVEDSRAMIDGTQSRMSDLLARRDRFQHRAEVCRAMIMMLMRTAEVKRRELPLATVSVRDGIPKVTIVDEAALPDSLCRFVKKPDLTKIKTVLLRGVPLAGATLTPASPVLTIRVR